MNSILGFVAILAGCIAFSLGAIDATGPATIAAGISGALAIAAVVREARQ